MLQYRLIVKRGWCEFHFMFKKAAEAASFVEDFIAHNVPCGDEDDDAKPITFNIAIEKVEDVAEAKEEN